MTYSHTTLVPDMEMARTLADELETLTPKDCWPFPEYSDLLVSG